MIQSQYDAYRYGVTKKSQRTMKCVLGLILSTFQFYGQ